MPAISPEVIEATRGAENIFPEEYGWLLRNNRARLHWQVQSVIENVKPGGNLVDLGGGIIPYMYICRKLGYRTTIVDDYSDSMYQTPAFEAVLRQFQDAGVTIIDNDVFATDLDQIVAPVDLITTHDSMEHWHNSPKKLFHSLWDKVPAGGLIFIGVPNCVNLRKRLTVPLGVGKWSGMEVWYEQPLFRGHVREPDVGDLEYIAKDLRARRYKIVGKNWLGHRNSRPWVRAIIPFVDRLLQLRPSLCSDIYLYAWK